MISFLTAFVAGWILFRVSNHITVEECAVAIIALAAIIAMKE